MSLASRFLECGCLTFLLSIYLRLELAFLRVLNSRETLQEEKEQTRKVPYAPCRQLPAMHHAHRLNLIVCSESVLFRFEIGEEGISRREAHGRPSQKFDSPGTRSPG